MNYDKFDAKPFCPHFYNCKQINDKSHTKEYMHPCVKGKSCDQLNCKCHTRFWYHFDLPTCPYGSSCSKICDAKHRASFHHEAKKGERALRDYLLNCDYCERCIINDKVHSMTFQHIRPFVFPEDGIAPKFVPDHKNKKCCQKACECTGDPLIHRDDCCTYSLPSKYLYPQATSINEIFKSDAFSSLFSQNDLQDPKSTSESPTLTWAPKYQSYYGVDSHYSQPKSDTPLSFFNYPSNQTFLLNNINY